MNESRRDLYVSGPNRVQQNGRDVWTQTSKALGTATVKQPGARMLNTPVQVRACLQVVPGRAGSSRWRVSHRSQLAREYAFSFLERYGFSRTCHNWLLALRIGLSKPLNDSFEPEERRKDRSMRFKLTVSSFVRQRAATRSIAPLYTIVFLLFLAVLGLPVQLPPSSNSVVREREVSSDAPLPDEIHSYPPIAPLAPPLS